MQATPKSLQLLLLQQLRQVRLHLPPNLLLLLLTMVLTAVLGARYPQRRPD